jgi:uncharacterized protein (DUF697 family)
MTQNDVPGDDPSGIVVSSDPSAAPTVPGPPTSPDNGVAAALARVTEDDLPTGERRQVIGQLAAALRSRGFRDVFRPKAAMAWLSDTLIDVAPRIPLRTVATLRSQHPGMTDDQIADRVVRNAARTTAGIGALGGGIAAVEWVAPPALLTAPAVLAAETLAVVAVEIKMLGELQELYGQPVAGSTPQRAVALVHAWASRRGVSLLAPGRAMTAVLGTAARHELRDRLVRRFGRNLTTFGPLFTGAAVAAYLNRRATRHLADEIRRDLTRQIPRQLRRD